MTIATPEMPAPAGTAATRSNARRAAGARDMNETSGPGTAPQAPTPIEKGSAPLGRPSQGSWKLVGPYSPGARIDHSAPTRRTPPPRDTHTVGTEPDRRRPRSTRWRRAGKAGVRRTHEPPATRPERTASARPRRASTKLKNQTAFVSTIDLTSFGNNSTTGHFARQRTLNKASSVGWLSRASQPSTFIVTDSR